MYAVIKSGGKQHKVSEGEEILLEKLSLDEGEVIEFSEVLAVNKDGNLNVGKHPSLAFQFLQSLTEISYGYCVEHLYPNETSYLMQIRD